MSKILVRTYLAYLLISVVLILPSLNFAAPWAVEKFTGRKLSTELILFNPFSLTVEVRNAAVPEHDGKPFVGLSSALVNLSLASIWSEGWVFDAIRVEGLYADVHRLKSGDFNFTDMLPQDEESDDGLQSTEEPTGIPGLTVHDFYFQSEWLRYTDEARVKPFNTQYDDLEIAVSDLSTVNTEGRPYTLDVRGEAGGKLHWEGQLSIPAAHSEGFLSLSNISLKTVSRFIAPWVKFELETGTLGLEGQYSVNWDDGLAYHIGQAQLALSGIAIAPQEGVSLNDTGVNLGSFTVSGLAIDGATEQAEIESIAVSELIVSGWSEAEKVSLVELFLPRESASSEETSEESNWSLAIAEARLSDSQLHWRSEFTAPAELAVSPVEMSVQNIQWPPVGETGITASLSVNNLAKLDLDALIELGNGNGVVDYRLKDLPVAWFNPNLPQTVNASIGKGSANADGQLSLSGFAPSGVLMNGEIVDFSLTVQEAENAITSWESVRWNQLAVDLTKNTLVLDELALNGYSGRLHIFEDGTINSQRALRDDQDSEDKGRQATDPAAKPWSYGIPSITITDSKLDFMDESLPIAFRTVIGELNGQITGISSDPAAQTTVDLKGSVDGYAPVKLAGTALPFSSPPDLDLELSFDGVDLARLTPYSGTYAGYAIDRGILNLDLKYTLEEANLNGHNRIVIEQLKLGEKVESDKAVDIPLGLAIALLTDMNGVIDMAVPVSGNVEDPQFNVGSVIFSAFMNIITKAVTAPFTLLAGLVSSEEDLHSVTFASGSTVVDEAAKSKLATLVEALEQRPELILVISGRLHPRADREKLQRMVLKDQIIAEGLAQSSWDKADENWGRAISSRYEKFATESPESELPSISEQVQRLAAEIQIPDSQLEALAEERAVEVKRYLVNEAQLPAERAVIETFDINDKGNLFSGVEMEIDA